MVGRHGDIPLGVPDAGTSPIVFPAGDEKKANPFPPNPLLFEKLHSSHEQLDKKKISHTEKTEKGRKKMEERMKGQFQ